MPRRDPIDNNATVGLLNNLKGKFSILNWLLIKISIRFSNRSLRFMDAYRRGLNGNQAAWASKKY